MTKFGVSSNVTYVAEHQLLNTVLMAANKFGRYEWPVDPIGCSMHALHTISSNDISIVL